MQRVTLAGSRARGDATEMSDWDFEVEVDDFDTFATELPPLVAELAPLGQQWDRFGDHRTYMLMLPGATKVDLILDIPQQEAGARSLSRETLPLIEHHFWDWIVWLASKHMHGNLELVSEELSKMKGAILGPLGVERAVEAIGEAVAQYRRARDDAERSFDVTIDRRMERDALRRLRQVGLLD